MKIQEIFKWTSASFALIPGLVVMSTNLGTPPGISKYLYGGLIEATGSFTLLILTLNQHIIKKISRPKLNILSITMLILFIISLLIYTTIYNSQVIYHEKYDITIFFPFWYAGDLGFIVSRAGSKYNSISNYGAQAVIDGINNSQRYVEYTRIIFTILYIFIFEFLVIGFDLLALRTVSQTQKLKYDT